MQKSMATGLCQKSVSIGREIFSLPVPRGAQKQAAQPAQCDHANNAGLTRPALMHVYIRSINPFRNEYMRKKHGL
jgi:hypothetical protein